MSRHKLQDHLAYPPRTMKAERAAAYLDMSRSKFLELVDDGRLPPPKIIDGVPMWESDAIDSAFNGFPQHGEVYHAAKPSSRNVVYFIACGDFIKIGFASSLKHRISDLNIATPYPLVVLATVSGDMSTEKRLHQRFGVARHKGEWFRKTPDLLAFIDEINDVGRVVA
jgi:Meiotically up-regulated gene 113